MPEAGAEAGAEAVTGRFTTHLHGGNGGER